MAFAVIFKENVIVKVQFTHKITNLLWLQSSTCCLVKGAVNTVFNQIYSKCVYQCLILDKRSNDPITEMFLEACCI